jgi:hypothetical protein
MKLAEFVHNRTLRSEGDRSTTYLPCVACYALCSMAGAPGQPCWGRVLYEPDYSNERRHLCAGHAEPTTYRPKP